MIELAKRDAIKQKLAQFGGEWVDLPTFLPAETVLELAGEALRSRLYFATAPDGRELCLRADLTIPAALHYIENHAREKGKKTYLCSGKVFRANEINDYNAHEFRQMGIEHFGDTDEQNADISLFSSINDACKSANSSKFNYEFFDGSLIKTLINNAQIDDVWREFLLDGCYDLLSLKSRIEIAICEDKQNPSALAQSLVDVSDDEATKIVAEVLDIAKLKTHEARGANEIAKRLKQKAMRANTKPLNADFVKNFMAILEINDAPLNAIEKINVMAKKIGVDLSGWNNIWRDKFEKINQNNSKFIAAKFGRFEYYDGFAFDIFSKDNERAIASGGRYNGLIFQLSNGEFDICAVGAVIRPQILLGE